jgi:hypothetical protein
VETLGEEQEEEGSMKSLPIPSYPEPYAHPVASSFELVKGMAAWIVMQETACDADTALAAIERQFVIAGPGQGDARDVMDRMSAACLDIVSRDE